MTLIWYTIQAVDMDVEKICWYFEVIIAISVNMIKEVSAKKMVAECIGTLLVKPNKFFLCLNLLICSEIHSPNLYKKHLAFIILLVMSKSVAYSWQSLQILSKLQAKSSSRPDFLKLSSYGLKKTKFIHQTSSLECFVKCTSLIFLFTSEKE